MRSISFYVYYLFCFLVPSGNFYFLSISMHHVITWPRFKSKMANETWRDGAERGLYNFVESLRTLLIGIQNLNAQDVFVEYFELANLSLEDAILTFQLLLHSVWQSEDSVLQDFEAIIEVVLTKVRFVFRVMRKVWGKKFRWSNSVKSVCLSYHYTYRC